MKQYAIEGMSCAACQAKIEKAVSKIEGVSSCNVSLLTNSMSVEGNVSDEDILRTVSSIGYGAKSLNDSVNNDILYENILKDEETPKLQKRLISSLFFLFTLMYISMGHNMFHLPLPNSLKNSYIGLTILQMLLAIIIIFINKKFFISGFKSLVRFSPNMDTLVALGSTISFLWSLYVLYKMCYLNSLNYFLEEELFRNNLKQVDYLYHFCLYFETSAMIPTLITVGKMLESISKGKTTDALKSLIKYKPKKALLVINNEEKEVNIDEVKIGDIFKILPGQKVPVDGEVIDGHSAIDESMLTGESIPVDKIIGDKVFEATINTSGVLLCKATRVGEGTTLNQIIKIVKDASMTKAPIARIADKVSGIFVPVVIAIAIIVVFIWIFLGRVDINIALERGIAVLVISCPCALGLATPVAIMVGNGKAAKHGILFKTGEALETLSKIKIIAFDKTGTITKGEPEVVNVEIVDAKSSEELFEIAYALEKNSEHPLAKAIISYVDEKYGKNIFNAVVEDFEIFPGNGITAKINGKFANAGNAKFISSKINLDDNKLKIIDEFSNDGKTPLIFEYDGKILGIIAVADEIKSDSKKAIEGINNLSIETVIVTGDNQKTANKIAKLAGVKNVVSNVLPDGKQKVIEKLQKISKVAMVGDGINDAIALVKSDVGIAIGKGSDVAIDSADVVLMNNKLTDVLFAIKLSKATVKNIYENLFWAFFYNSICIPLAAGLFNIRMSPMIAAGAMSLSSFSVCMNALRLNFFNMNKHKMIIKNYKNSNFIEKRVNEILNENIEEKGEIKMKKTIKIEGMMCGHCEATVKKAFENSEKVLTADVSHEKGEAILELKNEMSDEEAKKIVEDAGYKFIGA